MSDSTLSKRIDDYRLKLGGKEYVPLMLGGMGVDISTRELALVFAQQGGIGHLSDAMIPAVIDKQFKTRYVGDRLKKYKANVGNDDKSIVQFDLDELREAQTRHVDEAMSAKRGEGGVFINCMEKLTMNNSKETLRVRLNAALDAGIDGITLSAGLHLGSLDLIKDNPRFHEAPIGIIVSSVRALKLFLKRAARLKRLPDFVVVEGPLAGGHLGFGLDWAKYDLATITQEVIQYLRDEDLQIPVIPAGGIFTGSDGVEYLESGSSAVQVSTRFTITDECGLTDQAKAAYFAAEEDDIEVNTLSPTGYPMRMLKSSPAIHSGIRPNCESYGYVLDNKGHCSYIDAYNETVAAHPDEKKISVEEKVCLCTHMRKHKVWTCGHYTYRLKDTVRQHEDGSFPQPAAEEVFQDYQFSSHNEIKKAG